MNRSRIIRLIALVVLLALPAAFIALPDSASAKSQEDPRFGELKNVSDKFKFVRVRFGPWLPGMRLGDRGEVWSHDYPEAGLHFSKILTELSKLQVSFDEDEYIFSFEDPDLFKYPFAYLCEVSFMELSDEEIKGLREYLLRGGFILVDDFRSYDSRYTGVNPLQNLFNQIKRALPEYEPKPLTVEHPVFNCFFSIKSLDVRSPYGGVRPEFWGVEDKNGRLMMVINYNNDVSDYWQWSNDAFAPIEDTNTAYKFGVNYVFYALTH
jgi:hypothetical protein